MNQVLPSASTQVNADTSPETILTALRTSEEQAGAGYLTARKAMLAAAGRAASLLQLVKEHPTRVDYRNSYNAALATYNDASARTRLALARYHGAQHRSDAHWTDTLGRTASAA